MYCLVEMCSCSSEFALHNVVLSATCVCLLMFASDWNYRLLSMARARQVKILNLFSCGFACYSLSSEQNIISFIDELEDPQRKFLEVSPLLSSPQCTASGTTNPKARLKHVYVPKMTYKNNLIITLVSPTNYLQKSWFRWLSFRCEYCSASGYRQYHSLWRKIRAQDGIVHSTPQVLLYTHPPTPQGETGNEHSRKLAPSSPT